MKIKKIQPHLRLPFVKTLTNGWHTSSRMHEAICLPCILGCSSLPNNSIATFESSSSSRPVKDETAHYLNCPIMIGIISQASGLDHLPNMQELIFGNNSHDLTGVLACATSYHVYHSLKFGKILLIRQAIESGCDSGMFSQVRACAYSAAKAFLNDFDIQSNGIILCCGTSGLPKDPSHLGFLTNSPGQVISTRHSQGNSSLDTWATFAVQYGHSKNICIYIYLYVYVYIHVYK